MSSLAGDVESSTTGTNRFVPLVRDLMREANRHLAQIGATTTEASNIQVLLSEVSGPLTKEPTDENPTPGRVYGWQYCEEGARDCNFTMFGEGWGRSESDQKHITAHEFFHLAQRLVVPRVTCRSAWWVEGSAYWFANRVVHCSTWSTNWPRSLVASWVTWHP